MDSEDFPARESEALAPVRSVAGLGLSAGPRCLRDPATFACVQDQVRRDLELCGTQLEAAAGAAPDRLAEVEGPPADGEVRVMQVGFGAVFVEPGPSSLQAASRALLTHGRPSSNLATGDREPVRKTLVS